MRHPRLVLIIFVLSGAAGLMYEVVWSRQLVLVFGNTTQAVSTILTGFFGGMAVGSFIGGRIADRVRNALRLYGLIEIALVAIVLATPITFRLLHELYRGVFPAIEGQPLVLALIRFGLAILALAPATVLMGATLPTLTRSLAADAHLSKAFSRLYAANTIGAILGTLLAGVLLIELVGLTFTLVVGAALSGTAGVVAWLLSRSTPDGSAMRPSRGPRPSRDSVGDDPLPRVALMLAFVSGLTSLGYQVLWTRLLSSGTGNSTYVFTLILAMFLIGIALGAMVFSSIRTLVRRPILWIACAQIAAAALALLGLVAVIAHPGTIDPAKPLDTAAAILVPLAVVVLPATAAMGFTFPATSILMNDDGERVAAKAGRLLAANTAGSITATFAIPFFVIPAIGSPNAVATLALVNVATAIALVASRLGQRSLASSTRLATSAVAAVVALAIVLSLVTPGMVVDPSIARIRAQGAELFASHEDEIASVQAGATLTPQLWVTGTAMTLLTIDAKLMPILPLSLRPNSTSALVVAFGMGSAYRGAVIAGLRTTAVELVPTVPEYFPYFYPDAEQIESSPNGRIVLTDGRNHLELTTDRYDIIVTDPPPPIFSSGASVISSLEYYEAGRAHLNPGGIMMQWVPYGSSIDEFKAHVRTFHAVFPNVIILFGAGGYGLYMMGSDQSMAFDDGAMRTVLSRPGVLEDISSAYDSPVDTVDAWVSVIHQMQWIAGDQVAAFAGEGPLVTDDRPLPEYFLLRRWLNSRVPQAGRRLLVTLTP